MTAVVLALLIGGNVAAGTAAVAPTAAETAGICTYYAKNVMERVADYRGLERAAGDAGMVAVLDCEQIGERVWLEHEGDVEGPFLVADCAEDKHLANLQARSLVAEVDWRTSRRWEMAGPVACEIVTPPVAAPPAAASPVEQPPMRGQARRTGGFIE